MTASNVIIKPPARILRKKCGLKWTLNGHVVIFLSPSNVVLYSAQWILIATQWTGRWCEYYVGFFVKNLDWVQHVITELTLNDSQRQRHYCFSFFRTLTQWELGAPSLHKVYFTDNVVWNLSNTRRRRTDLEQYEKAITLKPAVVTRSHSKWRLCFNCLCGVGWDLIQCADLFHQDISVAWAQVTNTSSVHLLHNCTPRYLASVSAPYPGHECILIKQGASDCYIITQVVSPMLCKNHINN